MGSMKVWDGSAWQTAAQQGPAGPPTAPAGGATDNLLVKNSGVDYDTRWTPYLNSVTIGANAASIGLVRLMNGGGGIYARNGTNDGDLHLLSCNPSNQIVIGNNPAVGVVIGSASSPFGVGVTPVAKTSGWSATAGYTALKAFNPATATLAEVARMLGTLVDTLKAHGIILP